MIIELILWYLKKYGYQYTIHRNDDVVYTYYEPRGSITDPDINTKKRRVPQIKNKRI